MNRLSFVGVLVIVPLLVAKHAECSAAETIQALPRETSLHAKLKLSASNYPFAYVNDGYVCLRAADLHSAVRLFEGRDPRWVKNTQLAYTEKRVGGRPSRLMLYDTSTKRATAIAKGTEFAISPDSSRIAFKSWEEVPIPLGFLLVRRLHDRSKALAIGQEESELKWIDNSHLMFRDHGTYKLEDVPQGTSSDVVTSPAADLTKQGILVYVEPAMKAPVSLPGGNIASADVGYSIYRGPVVISAGRMRRQLMARVQILRQDGIYLPMIAWSPDSRMIAVASLDCRDSRCKLEIGGPVFTVFVIDGTGKIIHKLENIKNVYGLSWDSDSRRLFIDCLVQNNIPTIGGDSVLYVYPWSHVPEGIKELLDNDKIIVLDSRTSSLAVFDGNTVRPYHKEF